MKNYILVLFLIGFFLMTSARSFAHEQHNKSKVTSDDKSEEHDHEDSENHDHENSKENHKHEDKHTDDHESHDKSADKEDHKDNHEHAEHDEDEHGHEGAEENSKVGIDKGVIEASEEKGIKLSPEAEKNFEIKKAPVSSLIVTIPKSAIVTSGIEVNLYRFREGFYKRIDFNISSKNGSQIQISSKDLKSGDEIALTGLGFLRMAEIAAFGGAPDGHAH